MRLHSMHPSLLATAFAASIAATGLTLCSAVAMAESRAEGGLEANASKPMESAPGQLQARPSKVSARISAQAQLFVEQKEAPTASKTSLRIESTPRLSAKLKD